jgi:hypothetical protein
MSADKQIHEELQDRIEELDSYVVVGFRCASGISDDHVGVIPMSCTRLHKSECLCGKMDAYVYRVYSAHGEPEQLESGGVCIRSLLS